MQKQRMYISGPITGHIDVMKPIFDSLEKQFSTLFDVWSPMSNIPTTTSWQDAMQECRQVLEKEHFDIMLVIQKNDWTERSRGVKEEIAIAVKKGIHVHNYYPDRHI